MPRMEVNVEHVSELIELSAEMIRRNDQINHRLVNAVTTRLETMITNIHTYNPLIKVVIATTIPCASSQNAFGWVNHTGTDRESYKQSNFNFVKGLITAFDNRQVESIYLVPIHHNLDTEHNFPTMTLSANSRSAQAETIQTDNMHPTIEGYNQIADSIYFWLKCQED